VAVADGQDVAGAEVGLRLEALEPLIMAMPAAETLQVMSFSEM